VLRNIVLILIYITSISLLALHPGITTGNEYLKIKDYKKAYETYSEILVDNPEDKNALYGKSYSLFKMKKYKEALSSFEVLLKIDKNFKDSLYRSAFLYRTLKKYDKAIEHYSLYLEKVKDDPDSYYGLARTNEDMGDLVKATYYYYLYTIKETRASEDKWVKKAQKSIEKYRSKFTKEQQAKYEELVSGGKKEDVRAQNIEPLQKEEVKAQDLGAQNIEPIQKDKNAKPIKENSADKNLNYMFMKGVKGDDLYLSEKYNDAILEYRKYLKDPTKRREGLYKMAISNALLKKYPTSIKLLSQIILEEDNNDDAKELLKLLLINKGVVNSLKDANSSLKNNIGMDKVKELIKRGDYYEAIKILDILNANIKDNSSSLLYKIDLLRILSKNKEIEDSLKSFLVSNPDNVIVNEKYADFLSSQNKKEDAMKYYNIAISKTEDKEIKARLEAKISPK
jgi:predicted Zn-dependent protease